MLLKFFPFVIKKIKWFRNFFNSLNIISGINRFLKIMRNCCPLKKKAQNKQLYLNIYDIYFDIVQQLLKKNIRLSIPFFYEKYSCAISLNLSISCSLWLQILFIIETCFSKFCACLPITKKGDQFFSANLQSKLSKKSKNSEILTFDFRKKWIWIIEMSRLINCEIRFLSSF